MLCANRRFKVCFFIICIIFCGTAIHFLMLFHNYCCTLLDYTFSSQYSGFLYYLHKYYLFCWGTYFEFYLLISLTYVSSCSICSCSSNIYVIYKYICITAVTVTWRDFSIVVLNLIWLLVMYVPRASSFISTSYLCWISIVGYFSCPSNLWFSDTQFFLYKFIIIITKPQ